MRTWTWRVLSEELDLALENYKLCHRVRAYVLGDDPEIDRLYEQRWALLLENAPDYVWLTEDVPDEYRDAAEHENRVRTFLERQVDAEREAIRYRPEERGRRR